MAEITPKDSSKDYSLPNMRRKSRRKSLESSQTKRTSTSDKNIKDDREEKPDKEEGRKSDTMKKVRRSSAAALEHITANIGDADVGIDGFLGMEIKGMMEAQKELKEAIGDREEFKLKGCVMRFADIKEEHTFHEHWRRKSTPTAVCVISFVFIS